MNEKLRPGDIAFIVESNRIVREVKVLKISGGFYTIRFLDRDGAIKVRAHRIFATRETAEAFGRIL